MVILHVKNITYASCTDPNKLGAQDWNSAHQQSITLAGNTLGASTLSGSNIILSGGANISLSADGASIGIVGASGGGGLALSASDALFSTGTVVLTGTQNITIGTGAGSILISGPNLTPYLTTAALSGHSHGNPSLALTNLSGTTGSASNGLTLSLSAAAPGGGMAIQASTVTITSGTAVFTGSQNITLSANGQTVTVQGPDLSPYLTTAMASGEPHIRGLAGSNTTFTSGTVVLSGSQNITIGSAAGQIVITGPDLTPYLTTAALSGHSHGNPSLALTNLSGTTGSASNGLTLSLSAAAPGGGGGVAISASNSLWSNGTVTLTGSRNITVGTAAGQIVLTGPDLTPYLTTAALSGHSHGNPSLALTNLSGTTASNSAGLTLSLSASTYLTTAALSNHSHGNPSLALTNLSGTTASASNGLTLSLSAAAPGAGGGINLGIEGSTTFTSGSVFISNMGGVSLSTSVNGASQYIRLSAGGGGAGPADRGYCEIIQGNYLTTIANFTGLQNSLILAPFWLEGTALAPSTLRFLITGIASSNRSWIASMRAGIYSQVNSTSMALFGSTSQAISINATSASTAWNGARWLDFTGIAGTMTNEGRWMVALVVSGAAAGTASNNIAIYGGNNLPALSGIVMNNTTSATASTGERAALPWWGIYSATTNGLPANIERSQVYGGNSASLLDLYAIIREF